MRRLFALFISIVTFSCIASVAQAGPSSVKEEWFTSSTIMTIKPGWAWGGEVLPLPVCEEGRFLMTHMSVNPIYT